MNLIASFLTNELFFDDFFVCIATPLNIMLEPVTEDKVERLRQVILEPADGLPPEITDRGLQSVGNFMMQLGYDASRKILMVAAETVFSQTT